MVLSAGGIATRLTVHPGYEHTPRWSPDGAWIAFSGEREGDDDVFVIRAVGGAPLQLTFMDVNDQICGWTPDGKQIIFSSRRDDRYPDQDLLYSVPVEGGEPIPLTNAFGTEATIDGSRKRLLLTRQGGQWWRKGYRSSGSPQIWSLDLTTREYSPITDTSQHRNGDDYKQSASRWPIWNSNGELTVASERDGTYNLWRQNPSGTWFQLTHYIGDGVRFPTSALAVDAIVFEHGTDIWLIRGAGEPTKIEIFAPNDDLDLIPDKRNISDRAGRVGFSPDGKQMFLEVRGEIVATRIVGDDDKAARGRANNLSRGNPGRESEFSVSPGGDTLVVVTTNGNRDLCLIKSTDPETAELSRALNRDFAPLVITDAEEYSPKFSPDGKYIAFRRGLGDLVILDLAKEKEFELLKGWSLLSFDWSPDSRWIAFSREDNEFNSEVFIIPSAGGAEVNVSRHPDEDDQPVWSGDGSKLAFRSKRRDNNWDIYLVQLKLKDYQKSNSDRAEEIRKKAAAKKDKKDDDSEKKDRDKDKETVKVEIDTTDIYKRLRALTPLTGEESLPTFSHDGEKLAFVANHEGESDIYIAKWTGEDLKRLTKGGANPSYVDFESSGKRVRYLDAGGHVKSIDSDGGSPKDHPFDARILVDTKAEREQKFEEVWSRLNMQFYDANFHGQNWVDLRKKYYSWALEASCEEDFGDVVRIMMGELNASHMGYYSPHKGSEKPTGCLGLDFDFGSPGEGWLVRNVVAGGPCDRIDSQVLPGDRVIRLTDWPLEPEYSMERLLGDQVGQRVELIVKRGREEKRIVVKPINRGELSNLRYNEWVDGRRSLVDSLSHGKFGYLHIRGMGEESLARFEAELYSVGHGKDALVIDVRYNGGGWTTDWLLAMLQVKRHAVTFPRDGGPGYPQDRLPLYSWTKPIVALCNEHSFSNAEIFSHSIQTLKRGTLVGVPTPGGVISTGGDGLVDGSSFRLPLRGWYIGSDTTRNPSQNMEGNGAVPDIIVPLLPGEMAEGNDRQLIEAVKELTVRIDSGKN